MIQYGDITTLSGHDLAPVDLIVGGSPCQDLSVAGKRAGLEGKRSGLFLEMIRIIREMREATNGNLPRYALWENVPGASDSARYKALGNSIALPFWEHLAKRFAEIGEVKSIGSLFDGIGGFSLVFKRAGAETKWTSEIEPFCQRVVTHHTERGEL